jgi:hypothetical protein
MQCSMYALHSCTVHCLLLPSCAHQISFSFTVCFFIIAVLLQHITLCSFPSPANHQTQLNKGFSKPPPRH